jgi:hypothetical protein
MKRRHGKKVTVPVAVQVEQLDVVTGEVLQEKVVPANLTGCEVCLEERGFMAGGKTSVGHSASYANNFASAFGSSGKFRHN